MHYDPDHENPDPASTHEKYYPSFLFKEIVTMACVFVLVAIVLAVFFPVGLEDPADPTDNLYLPKPEWYFLSFYQLLKYLPGGFEVIATVVVPAGGFAILLLLPFMDHRSEKNPRKRPLALVAMGLAVTTIILLTLMGLASN